jgi:hypothetical protein
LRLNFSHIKFYAANLLTANISLTFATTKYDEYHSQLPLKYTQMQSPVNQYVIVVIVSLSIRSDPGEFVNILVGEHCAVNK